MTSITLLLCLICLTLTQIGYWMSRIHDELRTIARYYNDKRYYKERS